MTESPKELLIAGAQALGLLQCLYACGYVPRAHIEAARKILHSAGITEDECAAIAASLAISIAAIK